MAFCSSCGTSIAEGTVFCPNCGKAVSAASPGAGGTMAVGPASAANQAAGSTPLAENVAGMLAYFTIIPAIVFLLVEPYNRNRFVRFHCFQCLFTVAAFIVLHVGLSIVSYALPLLMVPIFGLLGLAEFAVWLLLVIKAYQGQMFKLPVVGDMSEKQ